VSEIASGWYRVWLVLTVLFLAVGVWTALTAPKTTPSQGDEFCVPQTVVISTDYQKLRAPDASEVFIAKKSVIMTLKKFGIASNNTDLNWHTYNLAEMTIFKSAQYKQCTALSKLLIHLSISALLAILLPLVFLILRWVFVGFYKTRS
jgi:hypothetical protein